uniref:Uncharacterized protein n=1 Tax=Physcomitrium patens TaxID=3218 RepID=A0A2K1IAX5_PHYPA|nr:hypothetical protein PHYPA_030995 [Physcomitrium patens]
MIKTLTKSIHPIITIIAFHSYFPHSYPPSLFLLFLVSILNSCLPFQSPFSSSSS